MTEGREQKRIYFRRNDPGFWIIAPSLTLLLKEVPKLGLGQMTKICAASSNAFW